MKPSWVTPRFCWRGGLVLLVGAATLLGGALAQERAQFRTEIELVQLQVGVVGADGEFVPGLKAEDSTVFVNGHERRVQVAYEVDLRAPTVRPAIPASAGAVEAPVEVAETPVAQLPAAARRHLLLLFDLTFTPRAAVRRAQEAASALLRDHLHPADLVAVAINGRTGFTLLTPFTADRQAAIGAVETLDHPDAEAVEAESPDMADDDLNAMVEESFLMAEEAEITHHLDRMRDLGGILQAIEGRKHVLWFSKGFKDALVVGPDSVEVRASLWDMVETFNGSDAVVHAVDPTGLRGYDIGLTADSGRPEGRRQLVEDGHHSLLAIADGTGGMVRWNRNDLEAALASIAEATAAYYLVAYRKEASDPPRVKLRVRVRRGDVRVSFAPAVLTPPPAYADMTAEQRQLQLAEALADTTDVRRMQVESQVVTFPANENQEARVAAFIEVSGAELERLAAERGGDEARLEVAGFALGPADQTLDEFRGGVRVDMTRLRAGGAAGEQPLRYVGSVDVPPGEGRLRLVFRESVVGELTTITMPYHAPALPDEVFLARPMLVAPNRLPARDHGGEFDPLAAGGRRFVPIADREVAPGEVVEVLVVAYNLPDDSRDAIAANLAVGFEEAASHRSFPLRDLAIAGIWQAAAADVTQILLRLALPQTLQPGEGRLWVRLGEPNGGAQHEEATTLFITPR